jgi:hypothetical protein
MRNKISNKINQIEVVDNTMKEGGNKSIAIANQYILKILSVFKS